MSHIAEPNKSLPNVLNSFYSGMPFMKRYLDLLNDLNNLISGVEGLAKLFTCGESWLDEDTVNCMKNNGVYLSPIDIAYLENTFYTLRRIIFSGFIDYDNLAVHIEGLLGNSEACDSSKESAE